jgi:hypothetical protein
MSVSILGIDIAKQKLDAAMKLPVSCGGEFH